MITAYSFRRRPDQTVFTLNQALKQLENMQQSIKVLSADGKQVIIIGEQPVNPETKKPYPFGIHTYNIKGDRLEEV